MAVGGDDESEGVIEAELLKRYGVKPSDFLVDAGCGSGRRATALASYLKGSYLGLDVVPELLQYAAAKAIRPDWRFVLVQGLSIPLENDVADMVSFFNVFTHLFHPRELRLFNGCIACPEARREGGFLLSRVYVSRRVAHVWTYGQASAGRHWRRLGACHLCPGMRSRYGRNVWVARSGFAVRALTAVQP
jgi:SAM-dependent methyltransferase